MIIIILGKVRLRADHRINPHAPPSILWTVYLFEF